MLPIVAIVGRPNTGKSTLFNRLLGERRAIESAIPGTTRDRIYQKVKIRDIEMMLVDTGGLEFEKKENIEEDVQTQAHIAIAEADIVLFVLDVRQELTSRDFAAVDMLRKTHKPSILVANKCDNSNMEDKVFNLYELGFGDPVQISALHGIGVEHLESLILKKLHELHLIVPEPAAPRDVIRIGFFGKPNVGKSSLFNALLEKNRVIVSEIPGTTRDSVDTDFTYNDKHFLLIDTAGLRRKSNVKESLEYYSVLRCFKTIERCDIALLILDSWEGISQQDKKVSQYILEQGKGLIIVVNKIDIIAEMAQFSEDHALNQIRSQFKYAVWAPIVFVSAKKHQNVFTILDVAQNIYQERKRKLNSALFDAFIKKVKYEHLPLSRSKVKPKIYSADQEGVNPPLFVFMVNDRDKIHRSYRRYLENRIRKEYGFFGTPLQMEFRNRERN